MQFADLLRKGRVSVAPDDHRHARPGWIQFDCPYCGRGTYNYHMGYNIHRGNVNCWRCGRKRTADVLGLVLGTTWQEAKDLLRDVPRTRYEDVIRTGTLQIPYGVGPMGKAHRSYLYSRGFDPDAIERLWGVGGIGIADRLAWRLFIPIHLAGVVVSWTTRSIAATAVKRYVSAMVQEEAVSQKTLLYGDDYVRGAAIIVEGPTDAWAGGPGTVATLGTSYSQAQLAQMARYAVRAICFDSQPDAQARARRLADDLAVMPGETHLVTLDAKDLATAPARDLARLRAEFLGV